MEDFLYIIAIFLVGIFLFPSYAQENRNADKAYDFPSIGPTGGAQYIAVPDKLPNAPAKKMPAPYGQGQSLEVMTLPRLDIPALVMPKFSPIPSPVIPKFTEIPDTKDNFAKVQEIPEVSAVKEVPQEKIATLPTPFIPDGAGGARTTINLPSTPEPAPLAMQSFGIPSTPVPSLSLPNSVPPYVWGQSSTPTQSLPKSPFTALATLAPYVWGRSSTPISAPATQNIVSPYVWGKSSTPVAVSIAPHNLGVSSTPHGASSTPRGQSSTPHGFSSTPNSVSSTPHGQSSTPRSSR